MELTYENIKAFMEGYYRMYSSHVNSAESIEQMNEIYTTNFTSAAYVHIKGKKYPFTRTGREEFKKSLMHGHIEIMETLIPNNIIIDEKKGMAAVLLTIENTIIKTGEKHVFEALALYKLSAREENRIKAERLDIFFGDPDKLNKVYFQGMLTAPGRSIGADEDNR